MPNIFEVGTEDAGKRLDMFLRDKLPDCGLRQARRLISQKLASLDGKLADAAVKIRPGSRVEIRSMSVNLPSAKPLLIGASSGYFFYFKPALLHTAKIAGKFDPSLENLIQACSGNRRILLQRLDYGTCGIVCAAGSEMAARNFRVMEKKGRCSKFYLCLLQGDFKGALVAESALAGNGRGKTRILDLKASEERASQFLGLSELPGPPGLSRAATWALVRIKRGARHQIRAHAASLGYPLLNDPLYGGAAIDEKESGGWQSFYLRHIHLSAPSFETTFLDDIAGSFKMPEGLAALLSQKIRSWNKFF